MLAFCLCLVTRLSANSFLCCVTQFLARLFHITAHISRDSRYVGFLLRTKNATRRTNSEREEVSNRWKPRLQSSASALAKVSHGRVEDSDVLVM